MKNTELAIIGAGPAGLSAAITAKKSGMTVALFDENPQTGGHLSWRTNKLFGSKDLYGGETTVKLAKKLTQEAEVKGVQIYLNSSVFGFYETMTLGVLSNGQAEYFQAKKIIAATGATERNLTFPGWTLPGVMTVTCLQILLNLHRVLAGKEFIVIGSENYALQTTCDIIRAGGTVKAVIENDLQIKGYNVTAQRIRSYHVPIYTFCRLQEVAGENQVEEAVILDKKTGNTKKIPVDTVCIALGMQPQIEFLKIADCRFTYAEELGGYVPLYNKNFMTTTEHIFVAGDVTGDNETLCSIEEGKLAAISAAYELGYIDYKEKAKQEEISWSYLNSLRTGAIGTKIKKAKERINAFYTRDSIN